MERSKQEIKDLESTNIKMENEIKKLTNAIIVKDKGLTEYSEQIGKWSVY